MSYWYRVFGASAVPPDADALLQHLQNLGLAVTGRFEGDEHGWFRAELFSAEMHEPIELERYLATEEGIRDELNAWAAWVEATGDSSTHVRLMQHAVSTAQLLTLECPGDAPHQGTLDRVCLAACQFLARQTAGVYQVDGQGLFAADATLLVPEN
jgi:hypothetical protein